MVLLDGLWTPVHFTTKFNALRNLPKFKDSMNPMKFPGIQLMKFLVQFNGLNETGLEIEIHLMQSSVLDLTAHRNSLDYRLTLART